MILILKIAMWTIQLIALISAINFWKYYKKTPTKVFLWLLVMVLISELLATALKEIFYLKNFAVYNLLTIVTFLIYLNWFKSVNVKQHFVKISFIIFILTIGYSLFVTNFFNELFSIVWFIGAILIMLNAILFYYNLLQNKDVITYSHSPQFWIATGLLIYHIGYLPMLLFKDYIGSNTLYYRLPILLLNFILYGSFIKSFTCFKTQNI